MGKGSRQVGSLEVGYGGGGGWVGSEVREQTALFRAHQRTSCCCLEPISIPLGCE
jgi:hypothetical protein